MDYYVMETIITLY